MPLDQKWLISQQKISQQLLVSPVIFQAKISSGLFRTKEDISRRPAPRVLLILLVEYKIN